MKAHRWFAVELNNLAWDLVEAERRSEEEVESMIHAAHASCYHWLQAGGPAHHQRAQCLLATVYAKAGLPERAMHHARRCLSLSAEIGAGQTAFDRATALGCAAGAALAAGKLEEARDWHRQALEIAGRFEDMDEKAIFHRLYPAPG